jgi:hypothetical protein
VSICETISIGTPARISSVARVWRSRCGLNATPVAARSDEFGDGLVAQRPADRLGPQVDEHVVAVEVAELGVHVVRV